MESNRVEVLKNDHRVVSDSKMKRTCPEQKVGTNCRILSVQSKRNSFSNRLGKRKRTDGCRTACGSHLTKTVLENYSNFMKSGLPQRLLFYQNDEWNDFPRGITNMIREDFRAKKAAIEVQINDFHILLDILYMTQVDVKTGSQTPIAWIDEAGGHFFPKVFSVNCEMDGQDKISTDGNEEILFLGAHEINLHLQIEVNGFSSCNVDECVEESNVGIKQIKSEYPSSVRNCIIGDKSNFHKKSTGKWEHGLAGEQIMENTSCDLEIAFGTFDVCSVKKLFLEGMSSCPKLEILDISKCSSNLLQNHFEIFEKQVELTKKYRGNSNVQCAWLASSKDTIPSILMYGLGQAPKAYTKYGVGVHLSAANSAHISANICDSDENGVRYMVFCRVILGNPELVHPGSQQSHPSCDEYDSGVDDKESPSQYIVWDMNVTTHIYPEFVVSFRMSPSAEGLPVSVESQFDLSGVTSERPQEQWLLHPKPVDLGINDPHELAANSSRQEDPATTTLDFSKIPKSPWMPLTVLIHAISDKVSAENMKLVHTHYGMFRSKKISRGDFIRRLRLLVGDPLLKSTIVTLHSKMASSLARSSRVPEAEEQQCC